MSNKNFHKAKRVKNDEYYTLMTDVEKELKHYKRFFKGKTVFCNCDDPATSAFSEFFKLKFDDFGLKKVISTHYDSKKPTYKVERTSSKKNPPKIPLKQNGDFRSGECIELLKESDIVVTNPPFSLFREYVAQLMEYGKKFVIIGNKGAVIYKEIFPFILKKKMWLGHNECRGTMHFAMPGSDELKSVPAVWFTNLNHKKRNEELTLCKKYSRKEYPRYDNYDAINVNRVAEIPMDYYGEMGVPVTFLLEHNPKQFKILGTDRQLNRERTGKAINFYINDKELYCRIIIRRVR